MKKLLFILALTIGASSIPVTAQEGKPPAGGPPGGDQRRQGGPGGQRPISPIIEALDLNKDGIIEADELAKAAESLKKLDKNGDGKITEDEYRPQRPGGSGQARPQGGGPSAAGGEPRPARPSSEQ